MSLRYGFKSTLTFRFYGGLRPCPIASAWLLAQICSAHVVNRPATWPVATAPAAADRGTSCSFRYGRGPAAGPLGTNRLRVPAVSPFSTPGCRKLVLPALSKVLVSVLSSFNFVPTKSLKLVGLGNFKYQHLQDESGEPESKAQLDIVSLQDTIVLFPWNCY